MADEPNNVGDTEMLLFVFGGFALLVVLWYLAGGPAKTDLRGIFLNPPAPVGNGNAYGPQITHSTTTNNN